jgi:hypothetical protein
LGYYAPPERNVEGKRLFQAVMALLKATVTLDDLALPIEDDLEFICERASGASQLQRRPSEIRLGVRHLRSPRIVENNQCYPWRNLDGPLGRGSSADALGGTSLHSPEELSTRGQRLLEPSGEGAHHRIRDPKQLKERVSSYFQVKGYREAKWMGGGNVPSEMGGEIRHLPVTIHLLERDW